MSFKPLAKIPPLRWALYRLAWWRTGEKIEEIVPYLRPGDRVLDVGAGNCVLCQRLLARGYRVVPLDLANLSFIDEIRPVVYDGVKIPFGDGEFDVATVITVLHHIPDPDAALAEIARTSRRLIVIEEIYDSAFVKYYTYAIDSLFNLEFFGHPRSNRPDSGWRETFDRLGLKVTEAVYSRSLGFLQRVTYVLDHA